jgi:hypothetical protein
MIELLTLLKRDGMERSLHTLPQLMHLFVGVGYLTLGRIYIEN